MSVAFCPASAESSPVVPAVCPLMSAEFPAGVPLAVVKITPPVIALSPSFLPSISCERSVEIIAIVGVVPRVARPGSVPVGVGSLSGTGTPVSASRTAAGLASGVGISTTSPATIGASKAAIAMLPAGVLAFCKAISFSMSPMLGSTASCALDFPLKRPGSISGEVRTSVRRLTSTGFGRSFACGPRITIFPARSVMLWPGFRSTPTSRLPSRTAIFTLDPGRCSIMIVVPVIDAVTDAARMWAPPRFFGT